MFSRLTFHLLLLVACSFLGVAARGETPSVVRTGAFLNDQRSFDVRRATAYEHEMQLWDTWDSTKGNGTGTLDYGPFKVGTSLELMVAGFPGIPGETLKLVSGQEILVLQPTANPGLYWTRFRWDLPKSWKGKSCHLVAEDASHDDGAGWLGVSSPLEPTGQYGRAFIECFLQLLICFLILIPGYAIVAYFPRLTALQSLSAVLLSTALLAYLVFFCYFASPGLGQACSFLIYAAAVASLLIKRKQFVDRLGQADFVIPNLLAAAVAVLYFSGNFLYGGIESPEGVAISRFMWGMPPDPLLPYWFAKIFVNQSPLHPFFADWLTSDRPPLQAGLYLLVWPFSPPRYDYQVIGCAAQSWVWMAMWFFLRQLKVSHRATAITLIPAIFSGMFFANSVFCWPKLLPAAFLLLLVGFVWGAENDESPSAWTAILAGACAAFAMLGHGGSAFGLAGIGIIFLIDRRKLSVRFLVFGAGTLLLLMTPWTLYQKRVDPPGDRLIKYHLAGHKDIDPRPSLPVIREAYQQISWSTAAQYKIANLHMLAGDAWWRPLPEALKYTWGSATGSVSPDSENQQRVHLRSVQFVHYLQAPGVMLLGLLGLFWLWGPPAPEKKALYLALRLFVGSALVWCVLMFGPATTSIHQSSYFTGACLFIAVGLSLSLLPSSISLPIIGLGFISFYLLWMSGPTAPAPEITMPGFFPGYALIVAASTLAILGLLLVTAFSKSRVVDAAGRAFSTLEERLARLSCPPFLKSPVVIVAIAAVILFVRKSAAVLNPQFWAEDGLVFFMGAYERGAAAFTQVYAGYLHSVPRLVAWASLSLDPAWIPTAYNYSAFLVHVLVIAAVFSKRISLPAKPWIALSLALVPHTGEVFINLTNVQWVLAVGLVLLLMADDPTTWTQRFVDGATALLAGLSGPFSVFFCPLFALRAYWRKSRDSVALLGLVALAAGIQAFLLFVHRNEFVRTTAYDFPLLASCLGARHWGTFWAGYDIQSIRTSAGWILLGIMGCLATAYLALRRGPYRRQRILLGAVWLCCSVPVAAKFAREAWIIGSSELGDRYFFHPHLFFAWLLIIFAAQTGGWKRKAVSALLVLALIGNLPFMRSAPLTDHHWKESVQPIREGKAFDIPITPEGFGVSSPGRNK